MDKPENFQNVQGGGVGSLGLLLLFRCKRVSLPPGPGGRRLNLASVASGFGHRAVRVPFINYC